ncbi:hypothetical protein KL910_001892 [Ogataea haglerorum]|nr:hypothetical protein KL945_002107 [Ogataea haglerorum]KAG7790608.1 hypothetical protein KL910_001892 [Ogataea haglerorum]
MAHNGEEPLGNDKQQAPASTRVPLHPIAIKPKPTARAGVPGSGGAPKAVQMAKGASTVANKGSEEIVLTTSKNWILPPRAKIKKGKAHKAVAETKHIKKNDKPEKQKVNSQIHSNINLYTNNQLDLKVQLQNPNALGAGTRRGHDDRPDQPQLQSGVQAGEEERRFEEQEPRRGGRGHRPAVGARCVVEGHSVEHSKEQEKAGQQGRRSEPQGAAVAGRADAPETAAAGETAPGAGAETAALVRRLPCFGQLCVRRAERPDGRVDGPRFRRRRSAGSGAAGGRVQVRPRFHDVRIKLTDDIDYLEKREVCSDQGGEAEHDVSGSIHALERELLAKVPDQVSDSVGHVKRERERGCRLEAHFGGHWQAGNNRHERGRIEGHAGEAGECVGAGDGVEARSEAHAGDSVERRQNPRQLRLVDLQVWRRRSVFSLCDKDLLLFGGRGLDGDEASDAEGGARELASWDRADRLACGGKHSETGMEQRREIIYLAVLPFARLLIF